MAVQSTNAPAPIPGTFRMTNYEILKARFQELTRHYEHNLALWKKYNTEENLLEKSQLICELIKARTDWMHSFEKFNNQVSYLRPGAKNRDSQVVSFPHKETY